MQGPRQDHSPLSSFSSTEPTSPALNPPANYLSAPNIDPSKGRADAPMKGNAFALMKAARDLQKSELPCRSTGKIAAQFLLSPSY
jgi:hypothetical protein